MMMMVLMSVFQIIVVIVFVSARSHVASLEFLIEFVRELIDHVCRMLLLL